MDLKDFLYSLPKEAIAQKPRNPRDSALLSVLNADGTNEDSTFRKLPSFLRKGDLLVLNDTKTIKARLLGNKPSGAKCEILLLRPLASQDEWSALVRPAKKLKAGAIVKVAGTKIEIKKEFDEGIREIHFKDGSAESLVRRAGRVPLPPYIERKDHKEDRRNYQTVYANIGYSVAAPTAGLHFTKRLLSALENKGINTAKIRLDVGLGTFKPISADNIEDHEMHSESYCVSKEAEKKINDALKEKRRVIAVGTTVVRALEDQAIRFGKLKRGHYESSIFIKPGYGFKIVSAMVTNFHLPGSTLLVLVSAFMGRERMLSAYKEALSKGYRFYSYGDAMLLFR